MVSYSSRAPRQEAFHASFRKPPGLHKEPAGLVQPVAAPTGLFPQEHAGGSAADAEYHLPVQVEAVLVDVGLPRPERAQGPQRRQMPVEPEEVMVRRLVERHWT